MTCFDCALSASVAARFAQSSQTSSDDALIQRIAKGDKLALRALYGRHQLMVFRFALRLLNDREAAEDVLNAVFFDVWRKAARFEARSSVSTWLLGIARYKALSILRRPRELELDEKIAEAIPDPARDPELTLQEKQWGELLRRCIEQLPSAQAETIDLVYYHGKSIAEVAEILGAHEATVKTRMFYARKKLAGLLQVAA